MKKTYLFRRKNENGYVRISYNNMTFSPEGVCEIIIAYMKNDRRYVKSYIYEFKDGLGLTFFQELINKFTKKYGFAVNE